MPNQKRHAVTVKLDQAQYNALRRIAARRGSLVSALAREFVNESLYNYDPQYKEYVEDLIQNDGADSLGENTDQ
jgi:hypothetical protein